MKKSLIIAFLIIPFILFSQENKSDLIKRSIVIFPFINNSTEEYEYLENTINDALTIKLRETGNYNIIDYNKIDKTELQDIYADDGSFSINDVKLLSISIGSDAALIGDYSIKNEEIKINLKAIDILTGENIAELTKTGGIGLELFEIINGTVNEISDEILKKITSVRKDYYEKQIKEQEKQLRIAKRKEMFNKTKSPSLIGVNLIKEGDFEWQESLNYWKLSYNNILINNKETDNTNKFFIENRKAAIDIGNLDNYDVLLFYQKNIPITKDKKYRVIFNASSSILVTIGVIMKSYDNQKIEYFKEKQFNLAKDMQYFSFTFKMKFNNEENSVLLFTIKSGNCKINIDEIEVFEIK